MPDNAAHAPKSLPNGKVVCTCGDSNCASLTQIPLAKYSGTEFHQTFKTIDAPSGEPLWSWQELKDAGISTWVVWTIVETGDPEDENWYAVPGYHVVNKIDYCVTENPWPHENIEAVYFEDDFEKED